MSFVDYIISPDYYIKAIVKLVLFLALPMLYFYFNKNSDFKSLFVFKKGQAKILFLIGVAIFTIIVGGYFLLGSFFDLSNITKALESDIGVNKNNFIMVSFYIAIVNSFLEEFFFRGFAFLELKKLSNRNYAMIMSATFFALYHIAMVANWFDIILVLLVTIILFIGGLLFNFINEKSNNIYSSWIVHMFANLGINFIGYILFGII